MASKNSRKSGGYGFSVNLTGPGTVFTIGFIALAIGMGVLLTRGVTPRSTLSDPGQTGDLELIPQTPDPAQKGLQLKTLKFNECASTVTVDLLLDRSSSMNDLTPSGVSKIDRLKEAVTSLLVKAKDTSIVGIQTFSSPTLLVPSLIDLVPISYYKDVKTTLPASLASITPNGATPTHDALEFSYQKLRDAIPRFPKDRHFNFIFISDGAPCPGIGCSATAGQDQDPRLYNPNPADEIKALGVTVYSLGIFSPTDRAQVFQMEDLLKSIASSPSDYYAAESGDQIQLLLAQISNKICSEATTPTQTP